MKKLIYLALFTSSNYVFADLTPVRGVVMACVTNHLSESINVRAELTAQAGMEFKNLSKAEFDVAADDAKCKLISTEYASWAWQAWDRPYQQISFAIKSSDGKIIKSNTAYLNYWSIWDKKIYLDSDSREKFSLGHLNMNGHTTGQAGYTVAELEEKSRYTYTDGKEYVCLDPWEFNCGVTATWWDPSK